MKSFLLDSFPEFSSQIDVCLVTSVRLKALHKSLKGIAILARSSSEDLLDLVFLGVFRIVHIVYFIIPKEVMSDQMRKKVHRAYVLENRAIYSLYFKSKVIISNRHIIIYRTWQE